MAARRVSEPRTDGVEEVAKCSGLQGDAINVVEVRIGVLSAVSVVLGT